MYYTKIFSLSISLIISSLCFSQSDKPFSKGSTWLSAKAGLSFYNQDLARVNNSNIVYQEVDNSLRFELIPQFHYAIADRLLAGPQIGFRYANLKTTATNETLTAHAFSLGAQLQYYFLKITPELYLYSELGANYNLYKHPQDQQNNYLKTYLDAGFSVFIQEDIFVSVFLKDILTYHSDAPNFENRNDFDAEPVFQEFIRFPHFSVTYRF